jgi:hypothetical protein
MNTFIYALSIMHDIVWLRFEAKMKYINTKQGNKSLYESINGFRHMDYISNRYIARYIKMIYYIKTI